MARTFSIIDGKLDSEKLSNFSRSNEIRGKEVSSVIDLGERKHTKEGREIITGNVISESVDRITEVKIDSEEWSTEYNHVLKLDKHDRLQLKRSEQEDSISSEENVIVRANTSSIFIINERIALLDGEMEAISIINEATEGQVGPVELQVEDFVEGLMRKNMIESSKQATFSTPDDTTDQITISGYDPVENNRYMEDGELIYIVASIVYRGQELTCGFHKHNGFTVYGPMNYPIQEIGDFVMDNMVEFLIRDSNT